MSDTARYAGDRTRVEPSTQHRRSMFWRHFWQMLGAMVVGMIVTAAIFVYATGAKSWDEATTRYPNQVLTAMAIGMTAPMIAWMLHRGMGWRNTAEMAVAMIVPVVPFFCLVWFDVTKSAQCGAYCIATVAAMLALMTKRRSVYATPMGARWR